MPVYAVSGVCVAVPLRAAQNGFAHGSKINNIRNEFACRHGDKSLPECKRCWSYTRLIE
jgi:hypothetical protein